MEALIGLVALGFVAIAVVAPILAFVTFVRGNRLQSQIEELRTRVANLDALTAHLKRRIGDKVATEAPGGVPPAPEAATAETLAPAPTPAPPPKPVAPPPDQALPRPTPPPPRPPGAQPVAPTQPRPDLATNLGPKLLVAVGALAVFAALGFFVKYAWDNDWVGPMGRVMCGAIFSLGLITLGVRLLGREYRPLGQGLAGAGLAGLYTSAFGAHGFYDLISRSAAGALLVLITACALLLASRLDARLLAGLAWVGGYLTPILLSTGEDRALSLFLYLFLLDAGALLLDRAKPWPETVPLAFGGTMLLYGGWFGQHFRSERFEVAAFGLVLFTALFALGMARKERAVGVGSVLLLGTLFVVALCGMVDRPAGLLMLSLALAAAGLQFAGSLGGGLRAIAGLAFAFPFATWALNHYQPDSFGIAAAWVVGGVLLFLTPLLGEEPAGAFFPAVAFSFGSVAAIGLAASTDKPVAILGLLAALAGVAILMHRRWPGAEVIGVGSAGISVVAWHVAFGAAGRETEALLLAVAVAGIYLVSLAVRGLILGREIGAAGMLAHLIGAGFLWSMLFRVLYTSNPTALGLASVALAVVYLALGLALLKGTAQDQRHTRTALGLAAVFLTIAIPVQLGLNGITLAWAIEGLVLLGLGVRFASALARAGAYGVLGLSVVRLFARHLPLHDGPFRAFMNPSFGTWLAVIVALGISLLLTRREPDADLERAARPAMATLGLLLLFGLLTGETQAVFREQALAGVLNARLMGGLAISVLWSLFATGLLASGLAFRNRPLFYAAYALFGITALKVVLVDLAELHTLYRILSFLALGILLMAGAYLNIRFRGRLGPREAGR